MNNLGGEIQQYQWQWQNQQITVIYETLGQGMPLLLLPAFSTVSMREEVATLGKLLSGNFQVTIADFPGFGDSARPYVNYNPDFYQEFIVNFVTNTFKTPIGIIAAGHSAGYVLKLAQQNPSVFSQIVLVAPTWRGPLRTMGASTEIAGFVRELVRSPILGQLLYKLNTLPAFLSWMYGRHVYVDKSKLTPQFIQHKWQNTQKSGARFAPASFVTGTLDPVESRDEFLALGKNLSLPLLVIIPESAPPKSRAEMDAFADLPGVESIILPGTLGMHEEYPERVANAILPFLRTVSTT
ncbi:alpha/beta fold hydrolase [Calothrix sp. 336/3]|uniref:alpha/beta fold hydrolase n=1 Tax=Calothrix sp. 336/3 TaxID=1337936 RepID=UPI0004E2B887|nr:alpha/beta hydrolase [Calothrix sp. 336/3]AKG22290.1 alpha/beta hydrolase [Calothrix sp. 336/3]